MKVDSQHPQMTGERRLEWQLVRDAMEGESAIKKRGEHYLPKPTGFKALPEGGKPAYDSYMKRAHFPEILGPSVAAMIGIIHSKESQIEMPDQMAGIWERANREGLTLEAFHRRITRYLLTIGRYGVLADAPADGGDPLLVGYAGDTIINWGDENEFFVLDETDTRRAGFEWHYITRYRVLEITEGAYRQTIYEGDGFKTTEQFEPTARGGKRLESIPFAVASAIDISANVITPPLIGVARAALAIYQLSADYRHQLYMSGQETLVALNGPAPTAVGAGVVHEMKGDRDLPPDLKYVSPSCSGIEAHKVAMQESRKDAVNAGARLFDETHKAQESGEARRLRFASETATLMSVAQSSAGLLERALRNAAIMMGLNPEDVVVTAPADLLDSTISPQDAQALMAMWTDGGISYETFYSNLQKGGIASTERDHLAESKLIDGETFGNDADPRSALSLPAMPAS